MDVPTEYFVRIENMDDIFDRDAHRALKFGQEIRTPAMQAGLTKRRLTFREIFSSTIVPLAWKQLTCVFVRSVSSVIYDETRMPLAA